MSNRRKNKGRPVQRVQAPNTPQVNNEEEEYEEEDEELEEEPEEETEEDVEEEVIEEEPETEQETNKDKPKEVTITDPDQRISEASKEPQEVVHCFCCEKPWKPILGSTAQMPNCSCGLNIPAVPCDCGKCKNHCECKKAA